MPRRLAERRSARPRAPKYRIDSNRPDEGHFFPGEVAELLDAPDLDHRQLRSIHKLVREQAGSPLVGNEESLESGGPAWRWARFSLLDVIATKEVVRMSLIDGKLPRPLYLAPVRKVCLALNRLGFENPLVELDFAREGNAVFVEARGALMDPLTGQLRFDLARAELRKHGLVDPKLSRHLDRVRREFRATRVDRAVRLLPGR